MDVADGSRVSGAASTTLTLGDLLETDGGAYSCRATNPYGEATPDRIIGQVGVALRGRDLGVAEELPDLLERETETDTETGKRVPQIVDVDVLETGCLADARPGAQPLE